MPSDEPVSISGVYPHLAVLSDDRSEIGIGAVVPWADRLWMITYPAHHGDGRLWQVTPDLELSVRPESAGGTNAGRLIHRETNQLVIGPYVIDAAGRVRVVEALANKVRVTAVARHLTDPARKVYVFGMEGRFFEVDVETLHATRLFRVQDAGVTGKHGKGGYTGQGRVVVANNGGDGALAQWDGDPSHRWRLVERKRFCEVTGPGGLLGASDDRDPDIPLWATGWDKRSVILKVLHRGAWHTYRLPKSSYSHDAAHGWFTEWPRVREAAPGRWMLDFHGMFFAFPPEFRPGRAGGLGPIATHLRMVPDWCHWNGRLVLAADDNSVMQNPLGGQPQSNLWFGRMADLERFGAPAGWGGPWVDDPVEADAPSDPMLVAGFEHRCLHLAHDADREVTFIVEGDADGGGEWAELGRVAVPPRGYRFHVLPPVTAAAWVRVRTDADCRATAYVHVSSSGGTAAGGDQGHLKALFAGLAKAGDDAPRCEGLLLPARRDGVLQFLARTGGDADETALYEVRQDMAFRRVEDPGERVAEFAETAAVEPDFRVDDASVLIASGRARYRLPKTHAAYDDPALLSGLRGVREVVTERSLMNCHGTFYEVPRGEARFRRMRPVATHGRVISDFCSWRGLLVMAGTRCGARPDGHYFAAGDGGAGLWFGMVDDLWTFGKPRGEGGPWKNAQVKAGEPSDPYLMTGFDKKTLRLSHREKRGIAFRIEVDFLATGQWHPYASVDVPAGKTVTHEFPPGFSAHWGRLVADRDCTATAWFVYE